MKKPEKTRPAQELDHAKIDPSHCLADGLFRPLRRSSQTPALDIKYNYKDSFTLQWHGNVALNISDQSILIALLRIASVDERTTLLNNEKLRETPELSRFLVGLKRKYAAESESCGLIETTCYEIGKILGLAKSGTNNKSIKASLERLAQTRTTIEANTSPPDAPPYWASQMLSCVDENDKLNIALNPMLTKALYKTPFTFINVQEQRQLSGEVAKRLHVWLSCWLGHGQERVPKLAKHPDWPLTVFNAVTEKHKAALAICVLTGARPSEIAQGVEIELVKKGATPFLKLRIKGSKVTERTGQPERILIVAIDSDAARHLVQCVESGHSTLRTHPANLCAATIKAGRKVFPNLKESVTPYVFRHHLASQMKAAGIAQEIIAQTLGHRATESQQAYGYAVSAKGTMMPIMAAVASIPVRFTHRNPAVLVEGQALPSPY